MRRCLKGLLLVAVFSLSSSLFAFSAEEIYKDFRSRIYQIKVVDIESDSRTSIGSGFVVADSQTVATNYHVISAYVAKPNKYKIMIVPEFGEAIPVVVEDFDIVNDLALLNAEESLGIPIEIAVQEPDHGAEIFSVGNPLDLGMTVVPGTYNGLAETAYYHRIHFSGSINAGMSGGPVFNAEGQLTGINVATSGNQVSFLVPAQKLSEFISRRESIAPKDMLDRAQAQLLESQTKLLESFLSLPREFDALGSAQVLGDIKGLVSCWGNSSRDENSDIRIVQVAKGCSLNDNIYISDQMTTGSLGYEFSWYDGRELSQVQFDRFLQSQMSWRPNNRANFSEVTPYECHEDFTQISNQDDSGDVAKSFFCARRYSKFEQLHDMGYIRIAKRGQYALISHITVSGVSESSALAFLESFTEAVEWQQ